MKWRVICIILLNFIEFSYSRSRSEVIHDAYTYSGLEWTVGENNILDVKHCDINASTATDRMVSGGNNIDDRSEYYDVKLQTCAASDGLWPYFIGQSVRGEAYAYGQEDSTSAFRLRIDSNGRWIAGRQGVKDSSGRTVPESLPLTGGYLGFIGIDCAEFIEELWQPGNTSDIYSGGLGSAYGFELVEGDSLHPGDMLYDPGGHVVLVNSEINIKDNDEGFVNIVHATPYMYSTNEHVRSVVREDVNYKVANGYVNLYKVNNPVKHYAYSAFPKISCIKCADTETEVVLGVKSKRALNLESARIIVDEGLESGTTIYAQDLETISSVDGNNINVATVSWAVALIPGA